MAAGAAANATARADGLDAERFAGILEKPLAALDGQNLKAVIGREFGLEDRVSFRQMGVYELAGSTESYDLVWFMGVFYHLRYPMLGLDIIARKTRRLLVFQTMTSPGNDVFFAATGVTDGDLLAGVRNLDDGNASTESLVMRSRSGTVRKVQATHDRSKLREVTGGLYG